MQGSAQKHTYRAVSLHSQAAQSQQHHTLNPNPDWSGWDRNVRAVVLSHEGRAIQRTRGPFLLTNDPNINTLVCGERQESWGGGGFRPPATHRQMKFALTKGELSAVSTKMVHAVYFWLYILHLSYLIGLKTDVHPIQLT